MFLPRPGLSLRCWRHQLPYSCTNPTRSIGVSSVIDPFKRPRHPLQLHSQIEHKRIPVFEDQHGCKSVLSVFATPP